jgi:hypothetical protein
MNLPKGIVYVNIPTIDHMNIDPSNVDEALKEALGWIPNPKTDKESGPTLLSDTLKAFTHVATKYRDDHGVTPVLVIDNTNKLPRTLLAQFQDYAKEAADKNQVRVVFVSSEGHIPRRMQERSSWSRLDQILEIGDISRDESLEYLRLQNVNADIAASATALVGGRMILLKLVAYALEGGRSIQVMYLYGLDIWILTSLP